MHDQQLSSQPIQLHQSAIEGLERYGIVYEALPCDPDFADTAAFCQQYGFELSQSANAIITASKQAPFVFACCVLLATCKLDVNRVVCREMGIKKASFATAEQTIELTGMQIGGVTPVGLNLEQNSQIPILIDEMVMGESKVIIGGGNRQSKIVVAPDQLLKLPQSRVVSHLAILK